MKRYVGACSLAIAGMALAIVVPSAQRAAVPGWPYGYFAAAAPDQTAPACVDPRKPFSCARPAAAVPDDGIVRTLPETTNKFTRNQVFFDYGPADWYPGDHPAMPDIVARGRQNDTLRACALCHYANTNEMIAIAALLTDEEAREAAAYFASMQWTPWVTVVESDTNPKVRETENGLFLPIDGAGTESLGQRIIEMPKNPERTNMMRDPRSGFVAYVPKGSIAKGEALVNTGGGKTTQCAICHGDDLNGLGNFPGIVGRTTSYTARQLYDFKAGTRSGVNAPLMKQVVAKLDDGDIIAITAYLASRNPQ